MEKVLVCQSMLRYDHMDECGIETDWSASSTFMSPSSLFLQTLVTFVVNFADVGFVITAVFVVFVTVVIVLVINVMVAPVITVVSVVFLLITVVVDLI